jgi:GxxExxY protein
MAALAGDAHINALSSQIIGGGMRVHRAWGPGLLERSYTVCLCRELTVAGVKFEVERPLPLTYLGVTLDCAYRADLIVEGLVLVEVKAVDTTPPVYRRQLLTYTKLARCRLGLLLNFGAPTLKEGIIRVINDL